MTGHHSDLLSVPPGRRVMIRRIVSLSIVIVVCLLLSIGLFAAASHGTQWAERLVRVILLRDHNTRIILLGTGLLGLTSGLVGTYMLLRKRALVGDALSHATLPGVCGGFVVIVALGGAGKELIPLLIGAATAGVIGVACLMLLRSWTPIKEDAALGIVLSVSFGLGVAMLGVIQTLPTGNQAGLEQFIYGRTASMITRDVWLIALACILVMTACILFYKEFLIVCFDESYAKSLSYPSRIIDLLMMMLVTIVTVIGLQSVGLILMVAMLVIPPAAARFWSHRLLSVLIIAAFIGILSGVFGATLSALAPRLPAGAVIVCCAAFFFFASALLGSERGILLTAVERALDANAMMQQHVLRAMYEWLEADSHSDHESTDPHMLSESTLTGRVPTSYLEKIRTWTPRRLRASSSRLKRKGLVQFHQTGSRSSVDYMSLTNAGVERARRLVRNHRLWEMYLIHHADVAPSHVDRGADEIEHVLDADLVAQLEHQLVTAGTDVHRLKSPHLIDSASTYKSNFGREIPE